MRARLTRLRIDARGATVVEFALILVPMCIMLLGTLELGYRLFLGAKLQGALHEAVRQATIGDKTSSQIDTLVTNKMSPFVKANQVSFVRKSYYQFSGVDKPEKLLTDKNGNGAYDTGDCWRDDNGNKSYDSNSGSGTNGIGGADDIFYYEVKVTFDRLIPLGGFLGWSNSETMSANTILRNQPYAAQVTPETVCS